MTNNTIGFRTCLKKGGDSSFCQRRERGGGQIFSLPTPPSLSLSSSHSFMDLPLLKLTPRSVGRAEGYPGYPPRNPWRTTLSVSVSPDKWDRLPSLGPSSYRVGWVGFDDCRPRWVCRSLLPDTLFCLDRRSCHVVPLEEPREGEPDPSELQ